MTTSSTPSPYAGEGRWPAAVDLVRRLFRSAYWSLSDFGWAWIAAAPVPCDPDPHGPPPGHPERLTGLPLTPVEHALERQLTG